MGAKSEAVVLHAACTLDRPAARIGVTWTTTNGFSGRDSLSQFGTGWEEKPMGGSPEAEKGMIDDLVNRVKAQQADLAKDGEPQRGFHNKGFGVKAELRVAGDIAPDLRVGLFQPGAVYPAIARFSNAGASSTSDFSFDQRGLAFRVKTGKVKALLSGATADAQDFLTTNSPITARDPVQFLDVARALTVDRSEILAVKRKYGLKEALRAATKLGAHTASARAWRPSTSGAAALRSSGERSR